MPSRKRTLISDNKIHDEFTDDFHWFPFLFVIMMPNTAGTIARAIRRHDYSLVLLCVSVCLAFFLLQFCLSKYLSLPKNDKSIQKFWLKLNMWFLYTAICFGFVYQFADFFPPQVTASLYTVVLLCSLFLFYVFVIVDVFKYWKIWLHAEDDHENRAVDAGKLNYFSVSDSDSVLERV